LASFAEKIKEAAKNVLKEGLASGILAYTKGQDIFCERITFVSTKDEISKIIWPSFGGLNPANYLKKLKGKKLALFAPGCVARAVVVLIKEGQIKREDVFLIGVPCPGMLDPKKLKNSFPQIIAIEDDFKENLTIKTPSTSKNLKRIDFLRDTCLYCKYPLPETYNILLPAEGKRPAKDPYALVEQIEGLDISLRSKWFWDQFLSRCIRCYACRNACPLCYCDFCFVDETRPAWIGKSRDPIDVALYHLVRAYHLAGRCVECGACQAACPFDIPVALLTKKLGKEALHAFGYEAGLSLEEPLLFNTFHENDPEDFIFTHKLKEQGKI